MSLNETFLRPLRPLRPLIRRRQRRRRIEGGDSLRGYWCGNDSIYGPALRIAERRRSG